MENAKNKAIKNYLTLYHRTSKENAEHIKKTGRFYSKENTGEVFLSNRRNGQAKGYGEKAIRVSVPKQHVRLDDEFPTGEKHYAVHHKHIKIN